MEVKYNLPKREAGGGTSFEDLGYQPFSAAETYAIGDIVIQSGKLYKFTAAHAAGEWTGEDAEETSMAGEIGEKATKEELEAARQELEDELGNTNKALMGDSDLPEFDPDTAYAEGKYVMKDGYAYRFVAAHVAGDPWDASEAVRTSAFNELDTLLVGEEEIVHLNITSNDALMEVDNLAVTISYEDGGLPQILHCDEVGDVTFSVAKGRFYTITYVDVEGYVKPASDRLKASSAARYINKVYENVVPVLTTTVTINVAVTGSSASILAGKTVTLALGDSQYLTAAISNNQAVFTGLQRGKTIKVILPRVATLTTPNSISLVTDQATVSATATYTVIPAGIAVVGDDGYEAAFEDFDFDAHNAVAIHVSTAVLLAAGCDYYVKIADLANGTVRSGKLGVTVKGNFPTVEYDSPTNLNGKLNTQRMIDDMSAIGETCTVALLAQAETLTIGGVTANGWLPTKSNLQVIIDNADIVNAICEYIQSKKSWGTTKMLTCTFGMYGQLDFWMKSNVNTWVATGFHRESYPFIPFFYKEEETI